MTIRGIEVDLVDVDRMRRSLARTPTLASRLFTDDEWAELEKTPPLTGDVQQLSSGQ